MSRLPLIPYTLTLLSLVLFACTGAMGGESNIIEITLRHPSQGDGALQKELKAHRDDDGNLQAYSMEVDSVICLDVQCEIIPVKLYWDMMGRYWKYELPENGSLTKTDHVVFTSEDYEKLDAILGDQDSLLKDLSSDRIIEPGKAIETAAGISAPTPVSLQHEVVEGASYTSYTLWHWANGEVVDQIQDLSARLINIQQLLALYQSGNREKVEFALKHLRHRNAFSQDILQTVSNIMASHGEEIDESLEFLMEASAKTQSNVYFETIDSIFYDCGETERTRILESLVNCHLIPPAGFFDSMSRFLPNLESYYEIHLMIALQEQRNAGSDEVIRQAIALLDHRNFLIARRAYWFLMDQDLDAAQSRAMESFRMANSDRI